MTELCGARATGINNTLTCGKPPHDTRIDPVHRFVAGDPATLEWIDPAAEDISDRAADAILGLVENDRQLREYPVIPAADRRPLGWLFNKGVQAGG